MSQFGPEPANLNASVITEPLDSVITALSYKIEREWPRRFNGVLGARELFLLTLKTADVTSRSVRYLCADKRPDPHRLSEYCLSVPPLNRTILDNLFTTMFVLEDLPQRSNWYHRAAWREERLELNRYCAEYGHLPEWKDWLSRLGEHSDSGIRYLGIASEEVADPKKITRWPNAGAMPNYGIGQGSAMPPGRAFMRYLDDWFYKDLSQQAHLGGTGLMKRASALLYERFDPERERVLVKNKYAWIGQTLGLMLALSSELEVYLRFGLRDRLSYVWGLSVPVIEIVNELYDKRYAALLAV